MKLLEIKEKKGYYYNGKEMVDIKNISAEGLLYLVECIYENDVCTCDEVTEDNFPDHVARTIYTNLYEKITDLKIQKEALETEWNKYVEEVLN